MKYAILFIAIMTVLPLYSHPVILADLDQGLYWGVEVGDRIDFIWNISTDEGLVVYEQVYINITDVPLIPEEVNESTNWLRPSYSLFYENGTPTAYSEAFDYQWDALPIGNWTFLYEAVSEIPDIEVLNDATFFGYTWSTDEWIFYLKEDGIVFKQEKWFYSGEEHFTYSGIVRVGDYGEPITTTITTSTTTSETSTTTTSSTSDTTTSNTTTSPTSSGITDNVLVLVGISGGGIVVILAVIILIRKKSP